MILDFHYCGTRKEEMTVPNAKAEPENITLRSWAHDLSIPKRELFCALEMFSKSEASIGGD